jgi:putative addiction module component (TIGR02574 family)
MNTDTIFSEIQKLSTAQKILLLEQAWDDVSQSEGEIPIPEWQKKALDERLEEHYANPNENNQSSSEVFTQLRQN